MDNLRNAGVTVSANSQLNRLTVPELDAMLNLFVARGVVAWQVALTVPMGRANEHDDWLLQPYELLDLFPRLAAVAQRAAENGVRLEAGNNVGYYGPHETVLRAPIDGQRHYMGCTAGMFALGIEADGSIKGCPSLPTASYVGGNIRERTLREIWESAPELTFRRERARAPDGLWGFCAGCYYARECDGGCSWTAHVFFGRRGNNPYCHHRALEHAAKGTRERLVRVAPAQGVPFDHGRFEIVVEDLEAPAAPVRRLPLVAG
jgi:radical SAM protein with 4Fe4S-binding SPASM domain